jgi:hypothetical protein
MDPDGPQAGIAEEDFKARASSRIALQHGVNVVANAG